MIVGITGLIGVLTGAVVVYIGMILQMRHLENKEQRRRGGIESQRNRDAESIK